MEVFPKRGEEDNGPTRETREYADYCEAAGWKFVGSVRKFCIFEQVNGEAVPIVTDEERLANVAKAERGILLYRWWMIPTLLVNLYSMGSVFAVVISGRGGGGGLCPGSGQFPLFPGFCTGKDGCGREKR